MCVFFKQKTAYEMRISDWSSDVCSSDLLFATAELKLQADALGIRKLDLGAEGGRLQFVEKTDVDPMAVIRLIQGQLRHYRMDGPDKLRSTIDLTDAETPFNAERGVLTAPRPDLAAEDSLSQRRRKPTTLFPP